MKKLLFIAVLFSVAAFQTAQAQIHFGVKGGLNYNSDSFQYVTEDIVDGAKSKTGYHFGVWTRFKLPIIGLYIRPELVYTSLKTDYTSFQIESTTTNASYNFQTIDIPVLLGKKILGIAHIFGGPSFQYIIDGDLEINNFDDVKTEADGLTVGLQLGAGVELGKLGLDVRWERAFSDVESTFINDGNSVNFDTRINQIIVGLSYRL